ncbi:PREDICTED: probable dynactin subunit 2 [Diuraphis noxia]|uniref:probable dynactin subunit 2 n=1 Tax=Diuraphis noxia TaxID=143948 RepID=UPI000763B6C3|nr:PREDICTED: probable dynactin subunit 2 [Diuraphis noxia]
MTVDSKYAHLSGIAYDQPDVYETFELPEDDQQLDYAEEDNDDIERVKLAPTEAYKHFKDKVISSDNIDFSDKLGRSLKTGYNSSQLWELAAQGEKETPLQKYYRLKLETEELVQEISSLQENKIDLDEQSCTNIGSQVQDVLLKLSTLNIEKSFKQQLGTSEIDNLQKYVETVTELLNKRPDSSDKLQDKTGVSEALNFQALIRPNRAQLDQVSQISRLEERLRKLEATIGTGTLTLKRLGVCESGGLIEAVRLLLGQLSVLNSNQLDAVDTRVSNLLPKLEQTAAKLDSQDPEKDKKINELYEIILKATQESHLLPEVLQRMVALESLHQKVGKLVMTISNLSAQHTENSQNIEKNNEFLKTIESHINQNIVKMNSNMKSLYERMEVVVEKLKQSEA